MIEAENGSTCICIRIHTWIWLHFKSYFYNLTLEYQRTSAKMGIKQLFSIIKEEAPDSIKEGEIKNQFGRKVAIVSSLRYSIRRVITYDIRMLQ